MQSPVQVVYLLRPKTRGDLLAAAAFASVVFTTAPFLLPAVSEDYEVRLGTASLVSTAQLVGFVLASWTVGRLVDPSRRLLVMALGAASAFNALSAATPWFSVLLGLRALTGASLAVLAWLGWQEVFGDDDRMGDVAVVGPVMGIVGAPASSALAQRYGADGIFLALAGLALVPLLIKAPPRDLSANAPRKANRSKPLPATRVILASLGLTTLGGSAVFVFGAAIGADRVGLDPTVVALAFSANALVGIPAARYRGARPHSGAWFVMTGLLAIVLTNITIGPVFWLAVTAWGFAFWAGVPGAFKLLADRSANPGDRAGDAQSVMAAGRALGPLLGAVFIEAGAFRALGFVAGALMMTAALGLLIVEQRVPIRDRGS